MSDASNYDYWLSRLEDLADLNGIDLRLKDVHYYTYFSKDWTPMQVIEDLKGKDRNE